MAEAAFIWDDSVLRAAIARVDPDVEAAITHSVAYHATRAVAYARQNAPWTDQTGNARNGLFSTTEHSGKTWRIIVAHSVPYGVWLEVRWNGRYQIIRPTVQHEGPELMRTVSDIFRTIGGFS